MIYGGQNIKNKDIDHPEYSTFGFFDGYYNVANKANFLSTEINYALPLNYKILAAQYYIQLTLDILKTIMIIQTQNA